MCPPGLRTSFSIQSAYLPQGGTRAKKTGGMSLSMLSCTRARIARGSGGAGMTMRTDSSISWLPSESAALAFQIIIHDSPQEDESIFEPAVYHVPGEAQNRGNFRH